MKPSTKQHTHQDWRARFHAIRKLPFFSPAAEAAGAKPTFLKSSPASSSSSSSPSSSSSSTLAAPADPVGELYGGNNKKNAAGTDRVDDYSLIAHLPCVDSLDSVDSDTGPSAAGLDRIDECEPDEEADEREDKGKGKLEAPEMAADADAPTETSAAGEVTGSASAPAAPAGAEPEPVGEASSTGPASPVSSVEPGKSSSEPTELTKRPRSERVKRIFSGDSWSRLLSSSKKKNKKDEPAQHANSNIAELPDNTDYINKLALETGVTKTTATTTAAAAAAAAAAATPTYVAADPTTITLPASPTEPAPATRSETPSPPGAYPDSIYSATEESTGQEQHREQQQEENVGYAASLYRYFFQPANRS